MSRGIIDNTQFNAILVYRAYFKVMVTWGCTLCLQWCDISRYSCTADGCELVRGIAIARSRNIASVAANCTRAIAATRWRGKSAWAPQWVVSSSSVYIITNTSTRGMYPVQLFGHYIYALTTYSLMLPSLLRTPSKGTWQSADTPRALTQGLESMFTWSMSERSTRSNAVYARACAW